MSTNDRPTPRLAIAVANLPRGGRRRPFAETDKQALLQAALVAAAPDVPAVVVRSRWGKPELPGNPAWVSLSHSGDWLAAAAAPGRVGIDVQTERETRFERLARRLDWPADVPVNDAARFAALWTVWEAAIKAHRRECRELFARFARHLSPGAPQLHRQGEWQLLYWQPDASCHASVLVCAGSELDVCWTGAPLQPAASGS